MEYKTKALLISVGGTPAPIINSIIQQQPEYIFFFASEQTRNQIDKDILPKLTYQHKAYDLIITPSAEDLLGCYRLIYEELPKLIVKWQVKPEELVVDYTGGTKTMSAALVLATIEISNRFTYIGGSERTKNGLGVVIDGKERMLYQTNPWESLAISARKEIALLFNKARYQSAYELSKKIADKVTSDQKVLFDSLADVIEGYYEWDKFNHNAALHKLNKGIRTFSVYADGSKISCLRNLSQEIQKNIKCLEQIKPDSIYLCYDLLANAKRRAELEHKYDDAVARLYRALEALAQITLKQNHQIDASDVKISQLQLPKVLKDKYKQKYCDSNNKIKLPSYAAYELLNELGDKLGRRFKGNHDSLRSLLNLRNDSILAHGFVAIKSEHYRQLLETICTFAEIDQAILPVFPKMQL